MKILKMDIFKNVQNENIRKVFFSRNRDFLVSLIHAVKIKSNKIFCDDTFFFCDFI
jgi:hypothetical protein